MSEGINVYVPGGEGEGSGLAEVLGGCGMGPLRADFTAETA